MQSFFKKLPRYSLRLLLAYLVYIFTGGVLAYLLPRQARNLPQTDSFYGIGRGPDRAVLVEEPQDAFARRVEVIRTAQSTLDVCYHCVKSGETTECFFAELLRAADRGVRVRVLLDGTVGGLSGARSNIALALRAHPNIEYRIYNPVDLLRPWEWNALLHDKFILADDRMLLLGGHNIGDEYFAPPGYEGAVTYDRDVLVLNDLAGTPDSSESVTAQAKIYMDTLWDAPETDKFGTLSPSRRADGLAAQEYLKETAARWEAAAPSFYLPSEPASQCAVPTQRVTLLHNPVSPFKKEPTLGATLAQLLSGCQKIRLQTPYATANPSTLAALTRLAKQGHVEYLTNSMASSPNYPAFSAYSSQRAKFLATGVEIYEYQSTDSIHGKSCVADGRISVVGSFNLDDRSLYIDTESVLIIDSPEFFAQLNAELDTLFAQSAAVGPDNAYLPGSGATALNVSLGKRLLMGFVSIFSRLFRFLI